MRPKILIISIIFSLVVVPTVRWDIASAAPEINQPALSYLQNSSQNTWTTQALYALGVSNIVDDHLRSATCSIADYAPVTACAGPILAITALGEDPREFAAINLVDQLESIFEETQTNETLTLSESVFAILGLIAAGEPISNDTIQAARNYLLANQNIDGGWPFAEGFASSTDIAAMASMALMEAGLLSPDREMVRALNYIKTKQNVDGGFHGVFSDDSNANTTAWVISMIYKMHQDPGGHEWTLDEASAIDYLLSLQTDEGWFEYQLGAGNFLPIDTTAQAAIALAGSSYPVRKIVYTPPAPPAPSGGMILPMGGPSSAEATAGKGDVSAETEGVEEEEDVDQQTSNKIQETDNNQDTIANDQTEEDVDEDVESPLGDVVDGSLIKSIFNPTVYLIEAGRKRWIPNETIFNLSFSERTIEVVNQSVIDQIPEGLSVSYPNGVYLRSRETQRIYQIKNYQKYHIESLETWLGLGAEFVEVGEEELWRYGLGV